MPYHLATPHQGTGSVCRRRRATDGRGGSPRARPLRGAPPRRRRGRRARPRAPGRARRASCETAAVQVTTRTSALACSRPHADVRGDGDERQQHDEPPRDHAGEHEDRLDRRDRRARSASGSGGRAASRRRSRCSSRYWSPIASTVSSGRCEPGRRDPTSRAARARRAALRVGEQPVHGRAAPLTSARNAPNSRSSPASGDDARSFGGRRGEVVARCEAGERTEQRVAPLLEPRLPGARRTPRRRPRSTTSARPPEARAAPRSPAGARPASSVEPSPCRAAGRRARKNGTSAPSPAATAASSSSGSGLSSAPLASRSAAAASERRRRARPRPGSASRSAPRQRAPARAASRVERRAHDRVVREAVDARLGRAARPRRVGEVEPLEDRHDLVLAVVAARADDEREVDLRRRPSAPLAHREPRVSATNSSRLERLGADVRVAADRRERRHRPARATRPRRARGSSASVLRRWANAASTTRLTVASRLRQPRCARTRRAPSRRSAAAGTPRARRGGSPVRAVASWTSTDTAP